MQEADAQLRIALEAAGFGRWEVDLRTGLASRIGHVVPARPGLHLAGYRLQEFLERVGHPADIDSVLRSFDDLAAGRTVRHRVEYRVRTPDDAGWIWMESYGGVVEYDPATGAPTRVAGVSRNIDDRKAAEDERLLLLREVDHRARNALAVVQSVIALTRPEDPAKYRRAIAGRVGVLARAHTHLATQGWKGFDLRSLLSEELGQFSVTASANATRAGEAFASRWSLNGDDLLLPSSFVAPLAMAFHELASNAQTYGALSQPGGSIELRWTVIDERLLHFIWSEHGGPRLTETPGTRGLGHRLMEATIRRQLGGELQMHWPADGFRCEVSLPLDPVVRRLVARSSTNLSHAQDQCSAP